MAEGAPLLREYRVKSLIEGSNPSLSARYAMRPVRGVLRIWRKGGGNCLATGHTLRLAPRAIGIVPASSSSLFSNEAGNELLSQTSFSMLSSAGAP